MALLPRSNDLTALYVEPQAIPSPEHRSRNGKYQGAYS